MFTFLEEALLVGADKRSVDAVDRQGSKQGNLLTIFWRQWWAERSLAQRGISFRTADAQAVQAAYAAMTPDEFDAINGRQAWANWRTIPRALSNNVPDRALRVADLGCGSGQSTEVLAYHCPAGSVITGYELSLPMIGMAKRRQYRHNSGIFVNVSFRHQGVAERWHSADGSSVDDGGIDVVNASGVVGHHLNPETVVPLVRELNRVLSADGVAMLDFGPTLSRCELEGCMSAAGFESAGRYRSSFFDPYGQLVFRRRK